MQFAAAESFPNRTLRTCTGEPDHSFVFKDVPLGRYLLEFNPDGPQSGQLGAQSYETTFYSQGTSRQHAKTIE
jgi:hypothetical protein